jgi:hypothetical protein
MSWALGMKDGAERLITYEALLRLLFSSARATGLCLYDRDRMPLDVIDGALCTHPVVRARGAYAMNEFYDAGVHALHQADASAAYGKLAALGAAPAASGSSARPRRRRSMRRR